MCIYIYIHTHIHTCTYNWRELLWSSMNYSSVFHYLSCHGHSFFKLINFNWRLVTLQYCGGFGHILTWTSHRCTCCPPRPEPPSHLPLNPIPLGCRSALALSALFHASNLDWSSVSHMVIYMFQCCSPKSSHPHCLPQSPKVCSWHLCLFCCLVYRVVITIFLNYIYMH